MCVSILTKMQVIVRKNKTISMLQKKLTVLREERDRERATDQRRIEQLTEQLYDENKDAIGKLRSAIDDLDDPVSDLPSDPHGCKCHSYAKCHSIGNKVSSQSRNVLFCNHECIQQICLNWVLLSSLYFAF